MKFFNIFCYSTAQDINSSSRENLPAHHWIWCFNSRQFTSCPEEGPAVSATLFKSISHNPLKLEVPIQEDMLNRRPNVTFLLPWILFYWNFLCVLFILNWHAMETIKTLTSTSLVSHIEMKGIICQRWNYIFQYFITIVSLASTPSV